MKFATPPPTGKAPFTNHEFDAAAPFHFLITLKHKEVFDAETDKPPEP